MTNNGRRYKAPPPRVTLALTLTRTTVEELRREAADRTCPLETLCQELLEVYAVKLRDERRVLDRLLAAGAQRSAHA
ncbi:MAG: hypothetical protein L0212_00750 [Acidobacteria bacterium]|nr:hypothetical protein [Acidobacteriota bacterium]